MTQTVLLGDICDVRDGTHDSPKPKDSGHPLVTSKHIKNHKIDFSTANLISDEDFEAVNKRSKVDQHDILISMIGTVGELALIDYEPTFAIKNIGLIKTGDELLGKYLFYYLQSTKAKQYIEASLAGSTQKFIGLGQLRKFPVELPDIETQKKIADILGTIDEKIELNRQMNETLEQMGQALFRHYFIDNPEAEKWEEETLGDIIELRGGLSYKAGFLGDSAAGTPMVTMGCVSGKYRINLGALKYYSGEYKVQHILNPGDMFIATRDVTQDRVLIGSPAIIPESLGQAICATNLYRVIKKQDISTEFLYQLMRTRRYREQIIANAKGSTIVMLTKDSVLNYTFRTDFDSTSYQEYVQHAEVLRQKIDRNSEEIQTLTTLRDTLLPRLISGKVKV